jgi:hypothetical protein
MSIAKNRDNSGPLIVALMLAQCVEPHTAHSIKPVDGSISFMGRFIVDEEIDGS